MVTPEMLQHIVALGRCGDGNTAAAMEALEYLKIYPYTLLAPSHWKELVKTIPTDDLDALARGFAIAEPRLKWPGGSVSPVVWICREIEIRDPARAAKLIDWISLRSKGYYHLRKFGPSHGSRENGAGHGPS